MNPILSLEASAEVFLHLNLSASAKECLRMARDCQDMAAWDPHIACSLYKGFASQMAKRAAAKLAERNHRRAA